MIITTPEIFDFKYALELKPAYNSPSFFPVQLHMHNTVKLTSAGIGAILLLKEKRGVKIVNPCNAIRPMLKICEVDYV